MKNLLIQVQLRARNTYPIPTLQKFALDRLNF